MQFNSIRSRRFAALVATVVLSVRAGASRIPGTSQYTVAPEKIEQFHRDGYSTLEDVLTEEEVQELEKVYERFMLPPGHPDRILVPGKDFCDMSKPFDTKYEDYSIINCMLPTKYYPPLNGNVYEKLAAHITEQLYPGVAMKKDYDQLLNKRPSKSDAIFSWHQDMAYWPPPAITPDTRTVTFSLAIDSTTVQNGCINFVPGSQKGAVIRPFRAAFKDREEGHAVQSEMFESDRVVPAPVRRGSVSIHDEYVVHGSMGNDSESDRRTYVLAFRPATTVAIERSHGFTHSHNDEVNWDTFQNIVDEQQENEL